MSTHLHSARCLRHRIFYVDQPIISPSPLSGQGADSVGGSAPGVSAPSDHDSAYPVLTPLRSFVLFGDDPGQAQPWFSTDPEKALEQGVQPLLQWAASGSAGVV